MRSFRTGVCLLASLCIVSVNCGKGRSGRTGQVTINGTPTPQETIFSRPYGQVGKQAVVFIHGGPGYNSADFEATTAEALAAAGFHVVVYDERGQGRSGTTDPKNYNYAKYASDLRTLIARHKLSNPILLAHSHGGPIAIEFDRRYPKIAKAIVLVDAPLDMNQMMDDLHTNCSVYYKKTANQAALKDLNESYNLIRDPKAVYSPKLVEAVGKLFAHALNCNLETPSIQTPKAKELREKAKLKKAPLDVNSMPGFLANAKPYIYVDHSDQVALDPTRYFGIYGAEDGLFSQSTLEKLGKSMARLEIISGASHAPYIDQQEEFIRVFKSFFESQAK